MKFVRRWRAWIVLAASLIGAVWVYSYRVTEIVTYVDPHGRRFHPDRHLSVQPWWSTPAAVLVAVVGVALFTRLLPRRERLLRLCTRRLRNVSG